jgi:protein SCO1/2
MTEQPPDLVRNPQPSSGPDEPAPRPPVPLKRVKRTALFTLALLALIAGVFAATITFKLGEKLEPKPSDIGGPFWLVSTAGKTTTERDLLGHWSLIYFGYTYCPDACPTALTDMGEALQALGNKSIQAYFITVDPERDTAPAMAEYLKSFDPRIVGLTGSAAQTSAAAAAYHVFVEPEKQSGNDSLIDHSAYVYVMDLQGRFVEVIDGAVPGKQMAGKINEMMRRYL